MAGICGDTCGDTWDLDGGSTAAIRRAVRRSGRCPSMFLIRMFEDGSLAAISNTDRIPGIWTVIPRSTR